MKLPNFLLPKFKCELIRLGQKNDGGYAIPKKSLENSKFVKDIETARKSRQRRRQNRAKGRAGKEH